ncbi:hypothetical protein NQ317_001317, partial [Molorchus minor]
NGDTSLTHVSRYIKYDLFNLLQNYFFKNGAFKALISVLSYYFSQLYEHPVMDKISKLLYYCNCRQLCFPKNSLS